VVVAPRFSARLMNGTCTPPIGRVWTGTWLDVSPGRYHDLFTGAELETADAAGPPEQQASAALPLDQVLSNLPVALLLRGAQRGN
jgi:(1->4)-alpha-D-glucan 1-alpha-D-glucosylmutase